MNLLVDPIQQRFSPAFNRHDLTFREMDGLCDAIEMLEGIFVSSQPSTLSMIFQFIIKFLQPIASLLARVNIEGNVAVAALRLYELISRKADLTEEWGPGEKKRMEVAVGELLVNYKRWDDGLVPCPVWPSSVSRGSGLMVDTKEEIDEDEPFVDVCYISDLLVNLIAGDSQQLGF